MTKDGCCAENCFPLTLLRANYKHLGFDVKKGFDILKLLRAEEHEKHIAIYKRSFAGETVTLNEHYKLEDVEKHIVFTFNPVRNEAREVFALAIFAKDVTEITVAKIAVEESARSIKSLMDVSGDSIMTIGRDNKVILSNETHQGSLSHLGIDIRDGFDVMNLFSKEEAIEKQKLYDRVFNGEAIEITDHLTINGADLYFLVKHAPLRDVHGNINSIAIFAKDITELTKSRMQAESLLHQTQQQAEELRAQEEELRQNMEEIHAQQEEMQSQLRELAKLKGDLEARELVFGFTTILSEADLHGTITYVNEKFCEVSGYTQEELIGKPHNLLRHPDMPKDVFKKMWSAIKKGETFKGIIKNRAKDRSHYWVDAAIVPVKDSHGKVVKYIGARYHIANDSVAEQLYKAQFKNAQFASA